MDLLQDLKMSLLNFNFVMIYIIHKMLVLLKNHLNYLKYSIFECFISIDRILSRGARRIWNNDLKVSWKFLTLMASLCHPRSWRNRGKLTSQVTSPSNHFCQICILAVETPVTSVIICCFLLQGKNMFMSMFDK